MSLSTDTPLLPLVVADCVCREVETAFQCDLGEQYRARLEKEAEDVYAAAKSHHSSFYNQMHGARCLEYLYMFMRHWLAAMLVHDNHELSWRVLHGDLRDFASGKELQSNQCSSPP